MIIDDNDKNVSTFKVVYNVKKGSDCKMLMDCDKVHDIENIKIKYMIASEDVIKSPISKRFQCTIIFHYEENLVLKNLSSKL